MDLRLNKYRNQFIIATAVILTAGMVLLGNYLLRNQKTAGKANDTPASAGSLSSTETNPSQKSEKGSGIFGSLFGPRSATPQKSSATVSKTARTSSANHLTPSVTATLKTPGGATATEELEGYFDGEMFYFPTEEDGQASPTPTWFVKYYTPRPTITTAPSLTPSKTATPKPTSTSRYTKTPSLTPTVTLTPSKTSTLTATLTPSQTLTLTTNEPPTETPTPTITPSDTPTPTPSATSSATEEPPASGYFAYLARVGNDGGRINLVELPQLTPTLIADFASVELCGWAPDGAQLLIQVQRAESALFDLQALALDGTATTLTGSLTGSSLCGDWLPDGSAVVFPYINEAGEPGLSMMDIATGEVQQLYADGDTYSRPDVSPDGTRVVLVSKDTDGQNLVLLNLEDTSIVSLTSSPEMEDAPRFFVDGESVVFTRKMEQTWDLCTINIDTLVEGCLSSDSADELWPDWSPDGRYLMFSSNISGKFNIYWLKNGDSISYPQLTGETNLFNPLWRP